MHFIHFILPRTTQFMFTHWLYNLKATVTTWTVQRNRSSTIRSARWPGASVKDARGSWRMCHFPDRATTASSRKLIICMCFKPCSFKSASDFKAFGRERQLHSVLAHCVLCEQHAPRATRAMNWVSFCLFLAPEWANTYKMSKNTSTGHFLFYFRASSVPCLHKLHCNHFSQMPFVWKYYVIIIISL